MGAALQEISEGLRETRLDLVGAQVGLAQVREQLESIGKELELMKTPKKRRARRSGKG